MSLLQFLDPSIQEYHALELRVGNVGRASHESASNLLRLCAHRRPRNHRHLQQIPAVYPEYDSVLEQGTAHILNCVARRVGTQSVLSDRFLNSISSVACEGFFGSLNVDPSHLLGARSDSLGYSLWRLQSTNFCSTVSRTGVEAGGIRVAQVVSCLLLCWLVVSRWRQKKFKKRAKCENYHFRKDNESSHFKILGLILLF